MSNNTDFNAVLAAYQEACELRIGQDAYSQTDEPLDIHNSYLHEVRVLSELANEEITKEEAIKSIGLNQLNGVWSF